MPLLRLNLFIGLLLGCVSHVFSQTDHAARAAAFSRITDSCIRQLMTSIPELPGLSIVVVRGDQPVFMRAYGWADKEKGIPADEQTLFYIASATKSFTGMTAAILDYEQKIKLDESLRSFTGSLAFKRPVPVDSITLRKLLTHTSGIQNDPLTFRLAYSGDVRKEDLLRVFSNESLFVDSLYGKYNYDNLGYNIYTLLLQLRLHKKWQDLIADKLLKPLGMHHSTAYLSQAAKRKWTVATSYLCFGKDSLVRSWLPKQDNNLQSGGGLFCSISDLSRWLRMNMNEGRLDGKQVIPAEVVRACHRGYTATVRDVEPFTGKGQYGIGWQIGEYEQERVIYHFGGFPGYRSHVSFMPDKKLAVAILVNEGSVGARVVNTLATYAYDWWLQKENKFDSIYQARWKALLNWHEASLRARAADLENRAKRVSQLSKPIDAYTGSFYNDAYGKIRVQKEGHDLVVSMGNMKCISTPYTRPETVRVELIPGTGEPLTFKDGPDGAVTALIYNKQEFTRTGK